MKRYCSLFKHVFFVAGLSIPLSLSAHSFGNSQYWRTVLGTQAGIAVLTNAGRSQTFPIETIGSDEFYTYTNNDQIKIPALYGGFVGAEWRNPDHDWGVQFDANYNQSSLFSVGGTLVQGIDTATADTYLYNYNMRTRQLLAQARVEYIGLAKVSPYFLAGLGVACNQAINFETTVQPSLAFTRMYANNNSVASCSYALGVGVDIELIEHVHINFGYKFSDLGNVSLGAATIDSIPVTGTLSQPTLYGNEFLVQVTIVF